MGMLRNIRHERFARLIANGHNKSAAYHLAGYKPDPGNAVRLSKNDKVRQRIGQIMRDSTKLSANDILDHVLAVHDLAVETQQCAPALKALELLGKERGLFRDRRENITVNIDRMSLSETEQYLIEHYGQQGRELIDWIRTARNDSSRPEATSGLTEAYNKNGIRSTDGVAKSKDTPYLALVPSSSAITD